MAARSALLAILAVAVAASVPLAGATNVQAVGSNTPVVQSAMVDSTTKQTIVAAGPKSQTATSDTTLVVDDNGSEYESIKAAVSTADPGDTIRVMPGTYRERVTLGKNVTLVAPHGATLNGTNFNDGAAFHMEDGAAPVIAGFTVVGYPMGVEAFSASGDWVVRNTMFLRTKILAVETTGDWILRNVSIRDTGTAVEAGGSTGDWLIVDSIIRNVTEANGIEAGPSTGNWTLRNVTVVDGDFAAVEASYSSGNWRIRNATLRHWSVGVAAIEASGDWKVRGSTFRNITISGRYDFWKPPLTEGAAIDATRTNGSWTARGNRFVSIDVVAIRAIGANPTGDADYNYFERIDDGMVCSGAVDCDRHLETWPPTTLIPRRSPTPTPISTSTVTVDRPGTPVGTTTLSDSGTRTVTSGLRTTKSSLGSSWSKITTSLPVAFGAMALLAAALAVGWRSQD